MISYLAQTDYKPDVDAALARYEGLRCLEEALRLHLVRIMRRVHSFYEGEPHRLLGAALNHWDVFNIKTVLRAQQVQVPPDRILSLLFPIGELDDVALGEMVRQPGVKESVDWLVTWGSPYGWPLAAAMPEYAETGNLTVLERALERFHVTRLQTTLFINGFNVTLVREMLGLEIDVTNLATILRTRGRAEPEQVRDYLLDGGRRLRGRHLEALVRAPDVAGVLAALEDIPYQVQARQYVEPLRQAWPRYEARHDLAVLEMALERYVIEQGIRQLRQDPLSVAIPIGYVWAKTNEVANLRQVANGLAVGLPRSAIEANLFLVS